MFCNWIISMVLCTFVALLSVHPQKIYAEETLEEYEIYAQAAVLMDADSGRILFDKNGDEKLAVASTTKIMTCILILEQGNLEDYTQISHNAARQPEVNGDLREGEFYRVEDLLYALMLESHNDAAVALAEYLAGSTEAFAKKMNEKALKLGCKNTYFITPNGLDAVDENGNENGASAKDMAKILQYCIMDSPQRETFIKITMKDDHSYHNYKQDRDTQKICSGVRNFYVVNKNAYRTMQQGVLTGKTGYTSRAGYCYVCAVQRDDRIFLAVVLGAGWPPEKTKKWKDCNCLYAYGFEHFQKKKIVVGDENMEKCSVLDGIPEEDSFQTTPRISPSMKRNELCLVMGEEEKIQKEIRLEAELRAPITRATRIGFAKYYLDGDLIAEIGIYPDRDVKAKEKSWYFQEICKCFFRAIS